LLLRKTVSVPKLKLPKRPEGMTAIVSPRKLNKSADDLYSDFCKVRMRLSFSPGEHTVSVRGFLSEKTDRLSIKFGYSPQKGWQSFSFKKTYQVADDGQTITPISITFDAKNWKGNVDIRGQLSNLVIDFNSR